MSENSSIFIIHPADIIEICFSRETFRETNESKRGMDVSQFLLLMASQLFSYLSQFHSAWKKWLFLVLQTAHGENFRLDSCRDYPTESLTGVNIKNLLVNEYDLVINMMTYHCTLRLDPNVKKNFNLVMKKQRVKTIERKVKHFSLPLTSEIQQRKIRSLDLQFILKRESLSKPSLIEIQNWLITWNPLTFAEFRQLIERESYTPNIDVSKLPPFISDEEITLKGWDKYRDSSLEQPWGLICPSCRTTFEANVFAKTCYSCQSRLIKA
ncbi:MAG: hypothetical protein JSV04_06605 [Candidatus Heimdallarchaeota archaeon]|nr:MAG: hypothetical protein JSV04_06605 [Candidatus Heimdallarchaeota archaeon]